MKTAMQYRNLVLLKINFYTLVTRSEKMKSQRQRLLTFLQTCYTRNWIDLAGIRILESHCECDIEPLGSISHWVSYANMLQVS